MGIKITKRFNVGTSGQFVPLKDGEVSAPIQFNRDLIFFDGGSYSKDEDGIDLKATNLADQSTILNINGVPTGVPANDGLFINMYDTYRLAWYNIQEYRVIFDLEGVFSLDYAYVWVPEGKKQPVNMYGSVDGITFKKLMPTVQDLDVAHWVKIDFTDTVAKGGNRYFVFGMNVEDFNINALVLYGRRSGQELNTGVKLKRRVDVRSLDKNIGTNGFYFEDPDMITKVSNVNRFYWPTDWFMGDLYRTVASLRGKTVNDITLRFNLSHLGSIDQLLQGYKNSGSQVMLTMTDVPPAFRAYNLKDPEYSKAIDPAYSTIKLSDTTNPMHYTFIARIAWNIAARYGANKNIDPQYLNLQQGEPVRVGLNQVYCLELGNEMDKWWEDAKGYHNPEEMAAYMSAIYDGHKGAMGPGFGIKNADPSLKVSMISLASGDNTAYIRKMLFWFDKYRGKGDYAFDVINYHWYNSTEGSQTVDDSEGASAHGLQPERGNIMAINQEWSDLRDRFCPSTELCISEVGWDEQLGGVFSPNQDTQFKRSRQKAYWLTRLYMCNQASGVDITNQYWFANQGGVRFTDQPTDVPNPGKFVSSGMVDGVQSSDDFNRFPLMSYWYVANFKAALTGYKFMHIIKRDGISNTYEDIVLTQSTDIWSMAYHNYLTNKTYLVIWLASSTFQTLSVTINIPESSVKVLNIDNAEIREQLTGVETTLPTQSGRLTLTINECPTFIETSNIGVPKPLEAENIKTQTITVGGGIFVTWTDRNINDYTVRISRSLSPASGFVQVFQGDLDHPSYSDKTATGNLTYYYKVEFVKPGSIAPPVDEFNTLNAEEATATSVYKATNGIKYGTTNTIAVHGDSVGKLIDLKGILDMPYEGSPNPAVGGVPPKLKVNGVKIPYIRFYNVPDQNYQTAAHEPILYPHALGFVLQALPTQTYEAWINDYGSRNYIGNAGTVLRVWAENAEVQGTTLPVEMAYNYLQVEYKAATIDVYLNGTYRGSVANPLGSSGTGADLGKICNALGVYTNSADFNWISMYIWTGANYNAMINNRQPIMNSICNKYLAGQMETNPYATNIQPTFNPATQTFGINYNSVNSINPAATTYQWWLRIRTQTSGGEFAPQILVGTGRTLPKGVIQTYIDSNTAIWLTAYVNQDNAFEFLRGGGSEGYYEL